MLETRTRHADGSGRWVLVRLETEGGATAAPAPARRRTALAAVARPPPRWLGCCWWRSCAARGRGQPRSAWHDRSGISRSESALHELDCEDAGFEWLVMHDAERSVFAWLRKGRQTQERCLVVVNFTPEVYRDYRIKVPFSGTWREVLNTDSALYGGTNIGNAGAVRTLDEGTIPEVSLVVPPLAAIFLVPER